MAVKMRVIGGKWAVKMAPENEGTGTTLARSKLLATHEKRKSDVVRKLSPPRTKNSIT